MKKMKKMKKRKTFDVGHSTDGSPVRVSLEYYDTFGAMQCARKAADIIARRLFGKSGYCRILNLDSWATDYSFLTYNAFVGYDNGYGSTIGRNIFVYVNPPELED